MIGNHGTRPEDVAQQPSQLKRWMREPLLHFLLIGAALFAIYSWLNPPPAKPDTSSRIELTNDDIRQLEMSWSAQWKRPPNPEEMRTLIEERVREEILYREALALGLDRGDTIVKRRMAQKVESLSDDVSDLPDPSPEELRQWYASHDSQFAWPARFTFRHVFFSTNRRGAQAEEAARLALEKADQAGDKGLGDEFMFKDFYVNSTADEIATVFGASFSEELSNLKPGGWSGPIESGLGWHLVRMESATPRRVREFEEVEPPEIKTQWTLAQRLERRRERFTAIRARYEVVLPQPSLPATAAVAAALGPPGNP